MSPRIAPLTDPYELEVKAAFDRIMPPGVPPLMLFRTLARDERLWRKFKDGSLLDKGHLTLRQREIIIHRVTGQCGSEYEWGVHAAFFAARAGLDDAQLTSTVRGNSDDPCWSDEDRILLRACDELHATCGLSETMWLALRATLGEMAIVELIMVAGFYRTVSALTNSIKLPLEPFGKRFPATTVTAA
jgi:alkylhydroperoxidase family enzyme